MLFRDVLRKLVPIGRKEAREQYCQLNQKLAELQTQLEEFRQWQKASLLTPLSQAITEQTAWASKELEAHRQWQETSLLMPLSREIAEQTAWASKVLEAHRQWQEETLRMPLSREITEQTAWASEALEVHRQWQESFLLSIHDIIVRQYEELNNKNKTYYWNNGYEKAAITANWKDMGMSPDFEQKYRKLIAGLDEISIRTINKILCRQAQYLSCEDTKLDLFTYEEQEELRKMDDTFSKEILKISDDVYAYGKYLLPINCFEPVVFGYKYCLSDVDNLDWVKGKTVVDAGAFIGDTALIFSELAPNRIISFEPVPENVELLKKTIQLNNLTNVTIEQVALGAKKGTVKMYVCGMGSTGLPRDEDRRIYKETIDLPVVALDQYAEEHGLTNIGLIKADIEGSEPDFLRGAKKVISEQRPILMICIYHNCHDFFGIKVMLEEWDLKYKFKIRKPTVVNATYEAMLIAQPE